VAGAGDRTGWRFPWVFAAAWTLAELARGQWFTGFPWGAGGYAHVEGPFAALAPWVGVYGVGLAAALVSAWLASALTGGESARDGRSKALAARAIPVLAFMALLLALRLAPAGDRPLAAASGGRLSVALLQGNIAQDEKFSPGSGVPLALGWYREQLLASGAQLIVAPETAVPLLPRDLPPGYLDGIAERFRTGQQALLLGLPLGDDREGYTNSVLGLAPKVDVYRYDKSHLVPFGEFIPPLFRWFTNLMQIPLGDFNRGPLGQGGLLWQGQRLAPNICYEDLFGEELAARFTDPARAPTVLVNLSNIAWFGDSVAIEQHLQISRMRSLELRRPMLRATNTGATAVIDHEGRVTARLPRLTRGVLESEVEGREGRTAFARWAGAWGLAPMWIVCLGLLALAAMAGRRPN
jgi:apolipoprotein N-acyltransferase